MHFTLTFETFDAIDEFAMAWTMGRHAQVQALAGKPLPLFAAAANEQDGKDEYIARLNGAIDDAGLCVDMGETGNDWRLVSRTPDTRPVTAEGVVISDKSQDDQQPASADAGEAPDTLADVQRAPKRKRRTKAEIAADEAAAKAVQEVPGATVIEGAAPALTPDPYLAGIELPGATVTTGLNPEIAALAATIDGADKMAHMNEGRDFIAKHGFPKYNETFALADVPANIAAHTPEQAALHRAAMQWLIAQGGAA